VYSGRRRTAAVLGVLTAAPLLSGCLGFGGGDPDAGTNGVARLPPATIATQAETAAAAAPTVRLSGTVTTNGQTYRLDMRLRPNGGVGEVSTKGDTFQLLRVDTALYLKANADFYGAGTDSEDGRAAAAKLDNKYVKVPAGDPAYRQFLGFTDKDLLLSDLFALPGTLTLGPHHTLAGTKTIVLRAPNGGSLDVCLQGKPYPLRYQRANNAGTLTLSDWGDDFTLTAPGKGEVVDYGKSVVQK
jgi:hypothetical protein